MDEILDFFNKDKLITRKTIPGGSTSNRIKYDVPKKPTKGSDDCAKSTQYADEHIVENNQQLIHRFDSNGSSGDEDCDFDSMNHIYSTFNFKRPTTEYPITPYRARILNAVRKSPFVVLEGPTACGKTTQVPQFILDEAYDEKRYCNIIVAQPRRIAAASNAERVASERDWQLGTIVGYHVGFDEKKFMSKDTRLLFCTTGILLEKLIRAKNFNDYTHIILDEVHERNKDMDFLFVIIKKLLVTSIPKPKIKIIIMSATIEASRFSEYFSFPKRGIMEPAPIITIEQQTKFRIDEYYLEQFYMADSKIDLKNVNTTNCGIPLDLYRIAMYLINQFDDIDGNESAEQYHRGERPTVLIFLPGIHEINEMGTLLKEQWSSVNMNRTRIEIVVLHSSSDSQQRKLAFRRAGAKVRKIILATNIAESSITVPDVKYVMDFCRTRIMMTDTLTNFSALQLSWAARNSCRQRAGRTGRMMNGKCYRFVEKHFYDTVMLENAVPELVSSPLENVILKAKLLEMGSPESILALAMDQPKLNDIANTILVLKEIGALLKTCNGMPNDMDGDISFIGRIMANLPIDVKIAKFIILGYCFSILEECIIIGAALNSRSLFRDSQTSRDNMRLYSRQLRWANSSGSDLVAMLLAYNAWVHAHNHGEFGESTSREDREQMKRAERQWAYKFCLDIDALYECRIQVNEITSRLERMNIKPNRGVDGIRWQDNEKAIILKVVIAGGFYPNIFARASIVQDDYAREAFKCIGTHDPRNTVYYTGFDRDRIRCLYTKSIREIFIANDIVPPEISQNVQVNFDEGSNKTFITFKNDSDFNYRYENGSELMPGKICTEVYKSIKMRQLRIPSEIWVMRSRSDEMALVKKMGIPIKDNGHSVTNFSDIDLDSYCLPRILDAKMMGSITNVESCNRFWFQPEHERSKVHEFEMFVQNYRNEVIKTMPKTMVGSLVIVRVKTCSDNAYHRAKVISTADQVCRLRLIDTGTILDSDIRNIFEYCGNSRKFIDMPPRCFECGLAQLQPSQARYPNGFWPNQAIELFKQKTDKRSVEIEVYSVTNGKANVFIRWPNERESMNDILICEQYGEYVDEDYISNYNHLTRKSQMECQLADRTVDNFVDPMCKTYLLEENAFEIDTPPQRMCKTKTKLNGPFSPLSIECHGLTVATKCSKVQIDKHSVNSVMLENDPQDLTEKYLVAATACYTDSSRRNISLRFTTQMPNIRGFGPLMALIFCPTMHVKCNQEKTHYTAIRTGLGYDSVKNRPMFEEHDIVFNLNIEISQHDIELVNQIRYSLDTLLLTYPGEEISHDLRDSSKKELLLAIKKQIVKLLTTPRQCINTETTELPWDPNFSDSPEFVPSYASNIYGNRAIFPIHNTLKTQHTTFDTDNNFLHIHCKELHHIAQFMNNLPRTVKCKLCNIKLNNVTELKMHLLSQLHCDNEKRIGFQQ